MFSRSALYPKQEQRLQISIPLMSLKTGEQKRRILLLAVEELITKQL